MATTDRDDSYRDFRSDSYRAFALQGYCLCERCQAVRVAELDEPARKLALMSAAELSALARAQEAR